MWGSYICYGGPHKAFTQILQKLGGSHAIMSAFVNSYRNSVYNQPFVKSAHGDQELSWHFEDSGHDVLVEKAKGISFSLKTEDEWGCEMYPTALREKDFEDSFCQVPKDQIADIDPVPSLNCTKCADHSQDLCGHMVICGYAESMSRKRKTEIRGHKCIALKSNILLSRLKQVLDEKDSSDSISYRCAECLKCVVCKLSGRKKVLSLQERFEQDIIEKSVQVDIEKKKVFADMPFLKDPVSFLKGKHNRSDNKFQALQVYKAQCRKANTETKEGMRKVHSDLVNKGFLRKLDDLNPRQKEIINEAGFKHFFPW